MTQTLRKLIARILLVPILAVGASGLIVTAAGAQECDPNSSNPLSGGSNCTKNESQPTDIAGEDGVFKTIANVLLFLIGAISVIMLIYGGVQYTISSGNSEHVQRAKNTILYSIVGVLVAILSYAIVNFVITSFTTS